MKCSQLFLHPVDTSTYKDYLKIVIKPIDLSTIIKKLKQNKYKYLKLVYDDIILITKNCYLYHRNKEDE
jgi:transcriptional activator SPT7